MRIQATKVFASYMGKVLKDYNVSLTELTDDQYVMLVDGRDGLYQAVDWGDFNEKTRLTKAIKIVYPYEYYASPRYVSTRQLNDMFKRNEVKSESDLKRMIEEEFTI